MCVLQRSIIQMSGANRFSQSRWSLKRGPRRGGERKKSETLSLLQNNRSLLYVFCMVPCRASSKAHQSQRNTPLTSEAKLGGSSNAWWSHDFISKSSISEQAYKCCLWAGCSVFFWKNGNRTERQDPSWSNHTNHRLKIYYICGSKAEWWNLSI